MPPPTSTGTFVGREAELARLHDALRDVLAGRGQLVLVSGEPGIGKTRLAQEFATATRQQGITALWGRCWEGGGAPTFWPWVQIVRSYLSRCDQETLITDIGAGATIIAQIVTEIRDRLPGLPLPTELAPEQARFRFFDSLATWMNRASQRQPLVLILDDLHWADASSLLLLQFFARQLQEMQVLVIGLYRDTEVTAQHPLSEVLGPLARESRGIALSGLTIANVSYLISSTAGITPSKDLITTVHAKTEGNPFFATEVVRLLTTENRLQTSEDIATWAIGLPPEVRETIRRHRQRLSTDCDRLLTIAAVVGREFTYDILAHIATVYTSPLQAVLLSLLQEAIAARMLDPVPEQPRAYRFIHTLVQETFYEDLPLPERVTLHREVGEALEIVHASNVSEQLTHIADHFSRAVAVDTTEKALRYTLQVAEQASAVLAYEDATAAYTRAIALLEHREEHEGQRAEILLALGDARSHAGHTREAREAFLQVAAIARKLQARMPTPQTAALLARAALGFGGVWVITGTGLVENTLVRLLEEARNALGDTDSDLHARILARMAAELASSSTAYEHRAQLSQQAVMIARRLGNAATLGTTLHAWHWANWHPSNLTERLAVTSEMITLAEQQGDDVAALIGYTWRAVALLETGDREQALHDYEAVQRLTDQVRQPLYTWWTSSLRTMFALLEGRFAEAEQLIAQTLQIGQRVHAPDALPAFGVQMGMLHRERGSLREIESAFRDFVAQSPTVPAWRCGLAALYSELAETALAREEFERVVVNNFADFPFDQQWLSALAMISDACGYLGDADRAHHLYTLLQPYVDRVIIIGTGTACYGAVARSLGILATLLQSWKEAEEHFTTALRVNQKISARPFLARTQYDYARMLIARGHTAEHPTTRLLLDQALATAHELGMIGLEEKIKSQQYEEARGWRLETSISSPSSLKPLASSLKESDTGRQTPDSTPRPPTPEPRPPAANLFRHEGKYWSITYDERTVRFNDTQGFHHLATLLYEPGRQFHVEELLRMTDGLLTEAQSQDDGSNERVRKAVTNRLRTALTKIKKAHPALWRHLVITLKTGRFCSYNPEKPMKWQV